MGSGCCARAAVGQLSAVAVLKLLLAFAASECFEIDNIGCFVSFSYVKKCFFNDYTQKKVLFLTWLFLH